MRYGRYGLSYLVLRVSLGLVFLWIGVDILRHPEIWLGYLPASLPFGIPRELGLKLNGIFDVVLGVALIGRVFPKITAMLAALHLVGVLFVNGIDQIVIRDVGLLGAGLALLLWPGGYRRGGKLWRRSSRVSDGGE